MLLLLELLDLDDIKGGEGEGEGDGSGDDDLGVPRVNDFFFFTLGAVELIFNRL